MVRRNSSEWLEAPNPKTRIVKRSTSLEDFYRQNDEDCLEIADNVVFERLRKDTNLDPLTELDSRGKKGNYESNDNRFRREAQRGSTTTEDSPVEDLKYKQLVFEENDPEAKTIDFETLQRKNRPADVLEYKRFLNVSFLLFSHKGAGGITLVEKNLRSFQNQPLEDGKPPKKAYAHTKTRVKPPPTKVMVKRDAGHEGSWTENEDLFESRQQQWSATKKLRKMSLNEDEEEENDKNEMEPPLVRSKRYVRIPHSGQSPHAVSYALNYNEQENKGWVKPLFSSIVYRLPVRLIVSRIISRLDRQVIVVCPGHPKNLLPPVAAGDRRGILLGPCHHSC